MALLSSLFKSKLVKDTSLYTLINILDKLVPFLIMPIMSRTLSPEEMGYYSLYQVTFNLLIPILTLSISSAVLLNYYKFSKEQFTECFSTGVFLSLILYGIGATIAFIFSSFLSEVFGLPEKWLQITIVIVLLQLFSRLHLNLSRVKREPIKYGLYSFPLTLSKNLLGLYFIFVQDYGWEGLVLGHFLAQLLFSIISIVSFVRERYLVKVFSMEYVKDLLRVGTPLSVHSVSGWLSMSLNRVVVNSILGAAATGSYGIGATFGVILTVMEDAINKAYAPYLYEKLSKFNDAAAKSLVKLTYIYYVLFFAMGGVLFVVGYYGVGYIFGDQYLNTREFILPLILSSVLNGYYKLHVNFIFFTKKTTIIARNTMTCAVINLGLAYIMTRTWGLVGAAYSAVVIQFILYSLTLYSQNKKYKLPWFYLTYLGK